MGSGLELYVKAVMYCYVVLSKRYDDNPLSYILEQFLKDSEMTEKEMDMFGDILDDWADEIDIYCRQKLLYMDIGKCDDEGDDIL